MVSRASEKPKKSYGGLGDHHILGLDKDIKDLQVPFELFAENVNKFACLRQVCSNMYSELTLNDTFIVSCITK